VTFDTTLTSMTWRRARTILAWFSSRDCRPAATCITKINEIKLTVISKHLLYAHCKRRTNKKLALIRNDVSAHFLKHCNTGSRLCDLGPIDTMMHSGSKACDVAVNSHDNVNKIWIAEHFRATSKWLKIEMLSDAWQTTIIVLDLFLGSICHFRERVSVA
jgi:hypothetical protein